MVRQLRERVNLNDIILKIDYANAFNTVRHDLMLETTFNKYPGAYRYTEAAYGSYSFLLFGDTIILSSEGGQQGNPEAGPLFCDATLRILSMESPVNIWYYDDGNITGPADGVIRDLIRIKDSEARTGLRLKPTKCEICFLSDSIDTATRHDITGQATRICPGITVTECDSLVILGAPMGDQAIEISLNDKIDQLEKLSTRLPFMEHHDALFILRNSFSIPKLTYILKTSPCFLRRDLLDRYDSTLRSALELVTNVHLGQKSWM